MFGEIFSVELTSTKSLRFVCRTHDGQPPKISSVAVRDLEADSELDFAVWLLVAAPEDAKFDFDDDSPPKAFIVGEPIPLEEWRPDDPRVISAMEQVRDEIEQIAIPVSEIRYGEIPSGFHQLHPRSGKPRALQPGRHYEITIQGFGTGRLEFMASQ